MKQMQKGRIILNVRTFFMFLALFPFFQPEYLKSINFISRFYNFAFVVIFALSIFLYFSKKRPPSLLIWIVSAYNLWLLFVTIHNHQNVKGAIFQFITLIAFTVLLDLFSDHIKELTGVLLLHFEWIIYLNLLSLLFFPDGFFHRANDAYGLTTEWFLGSRNNFLFTMFPGVLVGLLYQKIGGSRLRSYCLISVVLISQFIQGSGTAKVGLAILLAVELIPFMKKIITPLKGMLLAGVINFMIVVVGNTEFLRGIVEGVLQKDLTFSSRTIIWSNTIRAIQERPLGYGLMDSVSAYLILGNFPGWIWKGATHAHNNFLQILFQSGLIGFSIYMSLLVIGSFQCYKFWKYQSAKLLFVSLFIFAIISITENLETPLMYIILSFPFLIPKIIMTEVD